jgi:hypothetical protein
VVAAKALVRDIGIGGMVNSAAWLDATVGMEVLSIGRSAIDREDCVLELCGSQMLVRVAIQGTWIWIAVGSLDEASSPEPLFNVADGPQGWTTVRAFVAALERSGIKSLRERPVQLGEVGSPDCFVIG